MSGITDKYVIVLKYNTITLLVLKKFGLDYGQIEQWKE